MAAFVGRIITAATAPTTSDDSSKGMQQGYCWYDTVGLTFYICADPGTTGNAVWQATTASTLSSVTPGTVTASKALVVDSNKDLSALRNLTLTNLDAGASGTAGTVDVFPGTASKGKLAISCTDQTGDTTVSLVAGAMAAARTITLRDPGAAASLLTTTDSTAAATAATAVEITRTCDVSARLVAGGSTLAMTEAAHEGKIIALDTATGSVITLPASTGGGAVYRFLVTVTATSNSHIIKVANASDEMRGYVVQDSDTATAPNTWWAADNDDTITLNRSTTGLAAQGEYFEIVDAVLNHFFVQGYSQASGTEATPFSATV